MHFWNKCSEDKNLLLVNYILQSSSIKHDQQLNTFLSYVLPGIAFHQLRHEGDVLPYVAEKSRDKYKFKQGWTQDSWKVIKNCVYLHSLT